MSIKIYDFTVQREKQNSQWIKIGTGNCQNSLTFLLTFLGGCDGKGGGDRTSFKGGVIDRFLAGELNSSSWVPVEAFSLVDDSNWDSFSLRAFRTSSMNDPPKSNDDC